MNKPSQTLCEVFMSEKNPAAVALGSIRSERKTAAARINALKGGPKPSRYQMTIHRTPLGKRWFVEQRQDPHPTYKQGFDNRKEAHRMLLALRQKEREERRPRTGK